jgi:hypothetical protein
MKTTQKMFTAFLSALLFVFIPLASENPPLIIGTTLPNKENPKTESYSFDTSIPQIKNMQWDKYSRVIRIGIAPWPKSWEPWRMFIDGTEMSLKDEKGGVVVRPNAPLDQPPDGVIVGTLPWVTGLDQVDFPCCGSLQFSIPSVGMTNAYAYNLIDAGCKTASKKKCITEWTVHEGDLIIKGKEVVTIENKKYLQKGNIYIKDSAKLILKNSELKMERGTTPTIHVYLFVDPKATLIIDNSRIYPGEGENGGLTCVFNQGKTSMIDSPTNIHYFDMSGNASLTMENSSMIFEIGGLLQVTGGKTKVTNSTLGALALNVPAGGHLNATGIKSGTYFENWKVQDMIPDANYELVFEKVQLLEDDWTGELEHGSFERGWIFFFDRNSHVKITDSDLRKMFLDLQNETVEFNDLKVSTPTSLKYRDIDLKNIKIKGEWGFTINNSNVTFKNSDYLFLQTFGSSTVKLINSHIVEFIPRNFTGTMIFENGLWADAGEILGGVGYHSASNYFTIKGSLKMGGDLRNNLQWQNAKVTREFEVILTDSTGKPIEGGVIKIAGKQYRTDSSGSAKFMFVFDENNYKIPSTFETYLSGNSAGKTNFTFFTETPIRLKMN